jgi:MFS family permease
MWLAVLVPALFVGFFGHVTAVVAFMVTATSGLPDSEQGLATGLATLTQRVGPTLGVPVLGAVAATRADLLSGVHLALVLNVAVTVAVVALVWTGLRPRTPVRVPDEPYTREPKDGPLAASRNRTPAAPTNTREDR